MKLKYFNSDEISNTKFAFNVTDSFTCFTCDKKSCPPRSGTCSTSVGCFTRQDRSNGGKGSVMAYLLSPC